MVSHVADELVFVRDTLLLLWQGLQRTVSIVVHCVEVQCCDGVSHVFVVDDAL